MKRICCIVLIMIFAAVLPACHPTPQTAAVIDKTALEDKINGPAVSGNPMLETIPDTWQEELSVQSDVKIVADAQIELPDASLFPVTEALPHAFTAKDVQKYADILMQGQSLYQMTGRTKSDWEKKIVDVKAQIEQVKNSTDMLEASRQSALDELNAQLKSFEAQYKNASEEDPEKVPATLTSAPGSDKIQSIEVQADLGQASPALLSIQSPDDGRDSALSFYIGEGDVYKTVLHADHIAGLALPQKDAQEAAEKLLNSLGITNMSLVRTDITAAITGFAGTDMDILAADQNIKKCYVFHFSPVINGIPVTTNANSTRMLSQPEHYDKIWEAETLDVYIDESGVYRLDWCWPGEPGQVLNDNVALLDFETVIKRFKDQVTYQNAWIMPGSTDNLITIKQIKLGMMRCRLSGDRYVYLPVWDFIGECTYKLNGIKDGEYDVSFLTINAIDGSIIDRVAGY